MSMFAAAVGYVLSTYIGENIDYPELIKAIFWFLISFSTYFGAKRLKEITWFKLVSLDFFMTWAFVTIGVIIGDIVLALIDSGGAVLNTDRLVEVFYDTLPLALAPAATASLGLRDK